jgi:hypothetical protein
VDKLARIGAGLNAFKIRFEDSLLDEIRESYRRELREILSSPQNVHLFEGGRRLSQPIGASTNEYFLVSYGSHPLLWLSCNTPETYQIYRRFFDGLGIENDIKELVDHDEKIVMYSGFLVIGDRSPGRSWHVDYFPGANAYTLITPLFELDRGHGNLLYKADNKQIETYRYRLDEAVIFGDRFDHCTEPYSRTDHLRILLSMTFGTDKLEHWKVLRNTIGSQSNFLILPCGHRFGTCQCVAGKLTLMSGRNAACHCGSGKRYKYCHGSIG